MHDNLPNPIFFQIPLFTSEEALEDADLSMRARISGQCLFVLLYFKSFDSLLDKFSFKDIIVFLTSILCILVIGFRSHIVAIVAVSILLFFKKKKVSKRHLFYSVLLTLLLVGISQNEIVKYKINQMIERNERDNFDNKDYVRYRSFNFYVKEFPKNIGDRVLGVGLPSLKSDYGKYVHKLKGIGLIWADWGLLGLAVVLGIPAVLCIFWYGLKAFFTTVDPKHAYLCYWFLFMLLASQVTREIYRIGAFPIQGVILYLIANYKIHNVARNNNMRLKLNSKY